MVSLSAKYNQVDSSCEYCSHEKDSSLYHSISDVLSTFWDPLGIFDADLSHDRYSGCVPMIYSYAIKSKGKQDLVEYLGHLARSLFDTQTNFYNDKRAAELILALRDFYFKNNHTV